MRTRVLAVLLLILCAGCTTIALETYTLNQAGSLSDIRYREAMHNLAMTAASHWVLPAYSSIYAGTTKISDTGMATSSSTIAREMIKAGGTFATLDTQSLDVQGTRLSSETWTLDPVSAPEKLRAMRAANWWVLDGPNSLDADDVSLLSKHPQDPPPCDESGTARPTQAGNAVVPPSDPRPRPYFDVADDLARLPPGWLHVGCRKDVPRHVCYQAHCHGTYVWVTPDGMKGLSDFTLVIQGIARVSVTSVLWPRPGTQTITKQQVFTDLPARSSFERMVAKVTVYVDPQGRVTAGQDQYAFPVKQRADNPGSDSYLRSQIAASSAR